MSRLALPAAAQLETVAAKLDSVDRTLAEFMLMVNAGQEPIDLVDETVEAIFDLDNGLAHRDFHLGAVLGSIRNPSVEYVVKLVRAVLNVDRFLEKDKLKLTPQNGHRVVSVAGSGKKGVKTINISTPAAVVAASLGANVVKHASKGTSSASGSSDFFCEVGGIPQDNRGAVDLLNRTGFGLFSIEGLIPKFDAMYGGRVLAPTALSYALPATVTPVKADSILYGFSMPRLKESVLAIHQFGFDEVIGVNTTDDGVHYVDEAGIFRTNFMAHSRHGGREVTLSDPRDALRLERTYSLTGIAQKSSREKNIAAGVDVLRGRGEEVQNMVIALNAAIMLKLSGLVEDLREGFLLALSKILSGEPFEKLDEIVQASGGQFNNKVYGCAA
ncbi:hypothetical protein HY605_05075 [Candidatus Peregrinibacteria bacterium]|nr:hypothetical protein [Candidatus Peregrinibacteria bacterium]